MNTSELSGNNLPTEMTVGGITYEILSFMRDEDLNFVVDGDTMIERVKEMGAYLGKEDGEHILKYQDDIPHDLRERGLLFAFPGWRALDNMDVYFTYWFKSDKKWVLRRFPLNSNGGSIWGRDTMVFRRK